VNLKEAARRLGVHYQTAYRWVRSGELVAVRIGSRYEISDAAIGRFRARRAALTAAHVESERAFVSDIEAELAKMADAPVLDVEQATAHLARRIAEATGDMCVVLVLSDERDRVEVASCFEPDPRVPPLMSGAISATMRMRRPDEGPIMRTIFEGTQLFVPHVPQEMVRAWLPPEFHQQLDDVCIFGLAVIPMFSDGRPVGAVAAMRESPNRPLDTDDADRLGRIAELATDVIVAAHRDREVRAVLRAALASAESAVDARGGFDAGSVLAGVTGAAALFDAEGSLLARTRSFPDADATLGPRSTARLVSGELDFARDVVHDETGVWIVHDAAVRAPDASLLAIVTVATRVQRDAHAPRLPRVSSTSPPLLDPEKRERIMRRGP
jgi:excisionase family DNA binding protein